MTAAPRKPVVIGVAGWKNSGKTTMATRLIAEFAARGLRVASMKHAHHSFQVDDAETDSAKHRRAGAQQVAVISADRWALIRELRAAPEPSLEDMLAMLDPCDIVVVEGYKRAAIPKIEVRRSASATSTPLAADDAFVIAIAADHAVPDSHVPVFALDDIARIADFILSRTRT